MIYNAQGGVYRGAYGPGNIPQTLFKYDKDKAAMPCPDCGSKKTERQWASFFAVTSKKS